MTSQPICHICGLVINEGEMDEELATFPMHSVCSDIILAGDDQFKEEFEARKKEKRQDRIVKLVVSWMRPVLIFTTFWMAVSLALDVLKLIYEQGSWRSLALDFCSFLIIFRALKSYPRFKNNDSTI